MSYGAISSVGNRAADVRISASFPSLNDRLIIVPQSRFFIVGLFFGLVVGIVYALLNYDRLLYPVICNYR